MGISVNPGAWGGTVRPHEAVGEFRCCQGIPMRGRCQHDALGRNPSNSRGKIKTHTLEVGSSLSITEIYRHLRVFWHHAVVVISPEFLPQATKLYSPSWQLWNSLCNSKLAPENKWFGRCIFPTEIISPHFRWSYTPLLTVTPPTS